jgi:hypothetical protein
VNGLSFHRRPPVAEEPPERADIACFVGLLTPRVGVTVPPEIATWLIRHSWVLAMDASQPASALTGLPVPVENWATFDALFQWESRTADGNGGPTYLGMAVRSFFAQGGRKCYIAAVANSLAIADVIAQQGSLWALCAPSICSEQDRTTWKGSGVLFGLEDASFLLLPDLPELVRATVIPPPVAPPAPPAVEEHFALCDDGPAAAPPDDTALVLESAPRCDQPGYQRWSQSLGNLLQPFLGTRVAREVQTVVAMPLPLDASSFGGSGQDLMGVLPPDPDAGLSGFTSGFFQVCYPWLCTDESTDLPEQIQPPDGVLAGMLARNALTQGTYSSAALLAPNQVSDLEPQLGMENYKITLAPATIAGGVPVSVPLSLVQRVSLFGPSPQGIRLISDVTTSLDPSYRTASVRRLVSALLRCARSVGESLLFGPSGPRLWGKIQNTLTALLNRFWQAGALDGETASDAFSVRCDRSTMLQADLDAGRVIAQVTITTAAGIEEIQVVLALSSGDVSSQTGGSSPPAQEVA